jgi:hypothetical protein
MSVARFAFAGMACLVAMSAFSAPPMVTAVSSARAHAPSRESNNQPCLVGTPKCADIGAPPKACLVGGLNKNTCPTDAKAIAVSK